MQGNTEDNIDKITKIINHCFNKKKVVKLHAGIVHPKKTS